MVGIQAKGGKKNRKYGRNKKWCERYRLENRRIKNKIKKLRHRISVNAKLIARKGKQDLVIKIDRGAVNALKALT